MLSVGELDGSLPQIFSYFKNLGIPSAFSDFPLVLFSIWSAVINAHKTVFPAMKLNEPFTEGKKMRFKIIIKQPIKQFLSFYDMCRLMTTQLMESSGRVSTVFQDGKG